MIITLISIGLLILGIVGWLIYEHYIYEEIIDYISVLLIAIGTIATIVCVCTIIVSYVNVPLKQATLDMEYKTLLNEVAHVKDLQNEPVSDLARIEYTNVAERVLDWNKRVLEAQTLGNSPWTNWFYNDVERSMKLIAF